MGIIGQRFARKAVNTENAQILSKLGTLTATPITTYKNLMKALNVDLDPVFYANAKIFTNQDGFQWMSELEDGQNRPLLVPDVAAPDSYRFRGKEVVVLSNSTLATNTTKKTIPFYIGSMADYVAFFERKGVEVAVSNEAGFTKNATLIRAIERFGVTAADSDALKAYTVSTAS
jgi:HK97 family phage major capsid protein